MQCSLCGKVAWYQVGKRFFCGGHREEACKASQAENRHAIRAYQAEHYTPEGSTGPATPAYRMSTTQTAGTLCVKRGGM